MKTKTLVISALIGAVALLVLLAIFFGLNKAGEPDWAYMYRQSPISRDTEQPISIDDRERLQQSLPAPTEPALSMAKKSPISKDAEQSNSIDGRDRPRQLLSAPTESALPKAKESPISGDTEQLKSIVGIDRQQQTLSAPGEPALPSAKKSPISEDTERSISIDGRDRQRLLSAPAESTLSEATGSPPIDPFAAVDQILEKLEFGNIAFNAPPAINVDDTAIIQLLLGLATPVDALKQMIEAAGEKESARIQVSDRMEARLSGPNFAITAVTPEVQAVTRSAVTEWKWEVKPRSEGRQHLHLTLSVLINVDGTSTQRAIRTFDKEIEVVVTWDQQVGSFIKNNWQWLWAAILVPLMGWLWGRKKGAKPGVSESDS